MTEEEVRTAVDQIPVGAKIQVVKTNGAIVDVQLMNHEVEGVEKKSYGSIEVPALPPAITVMGGTRFGSFRIEASEIVSIAWVD